MKEILNSETRVVVNSRDRIASSTSSKGNQIKWCVNNKWIKADDLGYEGLTESIASRLLAVSNIDNYVKYDCVEILEEDTEKIYRGCISDNFLGTEENLVTLYRLFEMQGINLDRQLKDLSTEDKILYVCKTVEEITGLTEFMDWLCMLLEFDAFILNEDRHLHNIAVIEKTGLFRLMPIFDCGAGLLSDTSDYPLTKSIVTSIRGVRAKPFNTKFDKQLKAVDNINGLRLKIAEPATFSSNLYKDEEINRVNKLLGMRYSGLKGKHL